MRPALILAAGRSRRMGYPKALLQKDGVPVLKTMCSRLRSAGWDAVGIIVSDRSIGEAIAQIVPEADILYNVDPDRGMISSLRLGLDWAGDVAYGLLGLPVDHPLVEESTLKAIHDRATPKNVVILTRRGRRGHPTWWGKGSWAHLRSGLADGGARDVLPKLGEMVLEVPVMDQFVTVNVNYQEDAVQYGLAKSES